MCSRVPRGSGDGRLQGFPDFILQQNPQLAQRRHGQASVRKMDGEVSRGGKREVDGVMIDDSEGGQTASFQGLDELGCGSEDRLEGQTRRDAGGIESMVGGG
jgi:hypothetical protein